MQKFIVTGAILAGLAVIIGAFGAHGLKETLGDHISTYETGSKYHFYHALGLILTGILIDKYPHRFLRYAGYCFCIGVLFFSGSLYLLALKDGWNLQSWTWLGPITPIGGLFFIIGWILIIMGVLKHETNVK